MLAVDYRAHGGQIDWPTTPRRLTHDFKHQHALVLRAECADVLRGNGLLCTSSAHLPNPSFTA
jgi:hypothetical protein